MELNFKCGNEIVRLVIDREKRKLQIASSKTNYNLTEVGWYQLFDKGKEIFQDEVSRNLDDDTFKKTIAGAMLEKGYIMV